MCAAPSVLKPGRAQVNVRPLAGQDFGTALAVMEDMGLLRQGPGRDRSKRRWGLRADAADIVSALQGTRILQPVLPTLGSVG